MKLSILLSLVVGVLPLSQSYARYLDQGFWANIGSGDRAGRSGLCVLDHAEGRDLLIGQGHGYSPGCWMALRHEPGTGGYRQVFGQPPTLENSTYNALGAIMVGDVDPRPGKEVIVGIPPLFAYQGGRIEIRDGATKQLIRSFPTSFGFQIDALSSLLTHDVDGDGRDEILVNQGSLHVMRGDGTYLWSCPSPGKSVAIGQLDDDPGLELAGTNGVVMDLDQRAKQWSTAERMYWGNVFIHDVNGDGVGELLGFGGGVTAINVRTGQTLWNYNSPKGISAVLPGDINGDGQQELVVADAQFGGLHVLRLGADAPVELYQIDEPGFDRAPLWTSSGTFGLLLADPDSDGRNELVWCYGGAGGTGQGPSQVFIYDAAARAYEWISPWRAPPNAIPRIGDVTGDGEPELITAAEADILVYDIETLGMLNPPKQAAEKPNFQGNGLTIGLHDVDGDGCMEIAVAGRDELRILKFCAQTGFEEIWRATEPVLSRDRDDGFEFTYLGGAESIAVWDVDADGDLEVIVTVAEMYWNGLPDYVQIFDFKTGKREWLSGDLLRNVDGWRFSSSVVSSVIKDTDGDGHVEIVMVTGYGELIILDLATREVEAYDRQVSYKTLADSPDGPAFFVLEASGALHQVTWEEDGYGLHHLTALGSIANDALAFAPAPRDRWWVITDRQVVLVAPDRSRDWSSMILQDVRGGFAFHESGRGPEFFIGWLYGMMGFKTGHLFGPSEIRVETMVTPAESGREGYVKFSRGDAGVGLASVRFTLGGTAKHGEDYTIGGAFDDDGDGIWELALPDMNDRGVTFYPVADSVAEGGETIVMQFLDDPSLVYPESGPVEFIMEDDEPHLSISVLRGEVTEGSKYALEFLVVRSGDPSVPLTANYRLSGTADSKDFAVSTRTLRFKAGVRWLKLVCNVKADKLAEDAESVTVELVGGQAAWVDPAAASATGWILDGQPTVRLLGASPALRGVEVTLGSEGASTIRTAVKLQIEAVFADGRTTRKIVTAKVGHGGAPGRYLVKSGKSAAQVTVTLLDGAAYHRTGEGQVEFALPALAR